MKKMIVVLLLIGILLAVFVGATAEKTVLEKPVWTMVGDGNRDLKVNAKDALIALRLSVTKCSPFYSFSDYLTGEYSVAGKERYQDGYVYYALRIVVDVDNDGKMSAKDALQILQYAVGKRDSFPRTDISAIDSMIWEVLATPTDVTPTDQ